MDNPGNVSTVFHEEHLKFMLRLRDRAEKFDTLSATKIKLFLKLEERKVVKKDPDGFCLNTEVGDRVLDASIHKFNEYVWMIP